MEFVPELEQCIAVLEAESSFAIKKLNDLKDKITLRRLSAKCSEVDMKLLESVCQEVIRGMDKISIKMLSVDSIVKACEVVWFISTAATAKGISMQYLSGDNPWEFYMTYANQDAFIQTMANVKKDFDAKRLTSLSTPPKVGLFILCHHKKLFRAVILKVTSNGSKFSVLNVDTHECSFIRSADAYDLPAEAAAFPAQTLRCCVNSSDAFLEKLWCKELKTAFKSWLDSNPLTVLVQQKFEIVNPPQFLVKIHIFNEETMQEVNFTSWVNDKLLVEMKKAVDLKEDILAVLDELDPFTSANSVLSSRPSAEDACSTKNTNGNAQLEDSSYDNGEVDDVVSDNVKRSVDKVTSWISDCSNSKEKPYQRRKQNALSKCQEPAFTPSRSASQKSESDKLSLRKPSSSSISDRSWCQMSPTAPEFVPSNVAQVVITRGSEDDDTDIADLIADDNQLEQRICRMYLKEGVCRRIACTKEHVREINELTEITAEVCEGPFNDIDLPNEGAETLLRIEHVESGHIVYATLPDSFSYINDGGFETRDSLYDDLNSLRVNQHRLLDSPPVVGEKVLALGLQRSLGPGKKWLRAEVNALLDENTVEVIFRDFGNTEFVKTNDLRQIRPQFLHLPYQAVQTNLANITTKHDCQVKAKRKLESLIKGKQLRAEIVRRDLMRQELDVILYGEDGVTSINTTMVELGLCNNT